MPASTMRASRSGSSIERTPCPRRSARNASRQVRTEAGPSSSPPCGTSRSPARAAIANAGANSVVTPRRSSLDSPKPTTPRPAYWAASRAKLRASSGCRVRLAATTSAIPSPVVAEASRTASRTRSVNAVIPPKRAPYPDGSTWISSQRPPSRTSSSAASRTSRRTSSSVRRTDLATSYSRWKRNQPFSSAAESRGGHSLTSESGSAIPSRSASSSSVACRMDPVKCRCRCAFGSARRSRGPAASTSGEELLQPGDALDQVVVAERVRQPEVARRAERLTRYDRHLGLLEDVLGEVRGGVDAPPVVLPAEQPLDLWIGVERALGRRADHAVDVAEHRHDRPSPPVEGGLHRRGGRQVAADCGQGGALGDIGDVGRRVRLEVDRGLGQVGWRDHPPDAP